MKRALAVVAGAAVVMAVPVTASAAPPAENNPAPQRAHDLPNPLGDKQRELRQAALEQVLNGQATPTGENKVVQVAKGQYVELAQEDSDAIWTVLGEFSDVKHNKIPEPNRAVDNSTIWAKDFSQVHYAKMLTDTTEGIISVPNFYEELSSGRYTVTGQVEDWVSVPGTGASYGDNNTIGDRGAWNFVNDTLSAWYDKQVKAGKTTAEIDAYLSQFDKWDRYDFDGDANFDEADGYIDHFQAVHAGEGEETGGGTLGQAAIWSHRWYNQTNRVGTAGPTVDGKANKYGGQRIGQSKYWVGDYTVEPENGGVGVFAHEFGHDLGLPDLYDTSGNSGGAENSTGFWSLMSSGSYGNTGRPEDGIGTKPMHMGAWEKLQLGWLNYEVVAPGAKKSTKVGPSTANTKQAQAVISLLPPKVVQIDLGKPAEGTDFWYSGKGDNLDNSMLTAKPANARTLTAQVRYDIEKDWDYAAAVYSTDGGKTFVSIPTNLSTTTDPNGQNIGQGITGAKATWTALTADLSKVPAGALVGFRYWTDGAEVHTGFQVDDVRIDGTPVTSWTLKGFTTNTGSTTESYFNAYIAEYRQYRGYDATLQTGPYNFGDPSRPDWAERLPYQDGLLVTYWNEQYGDNNVGTHPGGGLILPVDAHPGLLFEPTNDTTGDDQKKGYAWRARVQSYDSTFGLEPTDTITLHDPESGKAGTYGGLPAVPTFDDTKPWYVPAGTNPLVTGWSGVDVPKTGTKIRVVSTSAQGGFMQIQVN
ncbi:peptidase M6 [Blastococcus sp. TF02-8]|uniref:immune inhibitor A domain-containing protein n=1 Tax=Blastococcus sp. TF02-8 TaxID=2250574 RepID=UPI000DEBCF89|nr:immune inhibitor A domain-containing protein [Blastococcus sp. TF02-8]RBY96291.1 peptidase M6 [Blastococcus sp. TF02-8]